jgi:outer membrane protein TolC
MHGSELIAAKPILRRKFGILAVGSLFLLDPKGIAGEVEPKETRYSPPGLTLLEAVRETLGHDPNIQLQEEQVQVQQGLVKSAAGQFDLSFNTALSEGVIRTPRSATDRIDLGDEMVAIQNITIYRAAVTNQFRTGISLDSGVELDRLRDNLYQWTPANRANVNFVLKIPLLRGAGRAATDAVEQAARVNHEASVLDLQQAIAARILNTVSAYWNCRSAAEQLQVLTNSQTQADSLVEAVGGLVRIGELASSELLQAKGDAAQKTAAVHAGEQALWQARQDLAQAIGWALGRMNEPPVPAFPFPNLNTNTARLRLDESKLIVRSLERRADYQSAQKAQEAARILEVAARKNTRPQLDLSLQAGYSGLSESHSVGAFFWSLNPLPVTGPNVFGTLSLQWPFANRTAQGVLLQRTAEEHQTQLRSEALARAIQAGILVALRDLENSRAAWEKSLSAMQDYDQAVDQELQKLRLRTVTILDVITLKDRMLSAHLTEVAARARYWTALARCRYETGWLVRPGATPEGPLTMEDLVSLPPWDTEEAGQPPK